MPRAGRKVAITVQVRLGRFAAESNQKTSSYEAPHVSIDTLTYEVQEKNVLTQTMQT